MVSQKSVDKQLKNIHFNTQLWGRAEISELPNILMEDEEIFECVNGMYEGGFALLCATNLRLLLIDKKPLKYLTVEDLRFDMINQIDYSHRIMGARINVSTGSKNLKFTSYNQQRLRKLIGHIQHRMAEIKTDQTSAAETQQQHLEKINQQLQAYLLAQHQQQEELRKQLDQRVKDAGGVSASTSSDTQNSDEPQADDTVKPSPELADFLFAQSLLKQYQDNEQRLQSQIDASPIKQTAEEPVPILPPPARAATMQENDTEEILAAARAEVFGKTKLHLPSAPAQSASASAATVPAKPLFLAGIEINPLRIAYAKLPMALRNRRFGRPSFHAYTQAPLPGMRQTAP
ncbi:MAG: hypothetical protein JWM81_725 [Candidatus Saccharibacteria bacterium]|nr:hypothetical protein [Candidatus Saccharibacteria bacterium]